MRCQQCHIELLPGAQYCYACGSQIQPQCQSCQTVNPPGSNFCFSCGHPLQLEPPGFTEPAPAQVHVETLVCPRCHERNEPGSAYCYSCGLPLDDASHPQGAVNQIPAFALGRPGGFWIRFLAYLIDAILLTALFAIVWPIVSGESIAHYWASSDGFTGGDLFSVVLNLLYYTVGVSMWATTVGKRVFGLYVVRTDGSKVGVGRALGRYLAYILSGIILGIGFLMIAFRQDKRGLHDLICDTVVIRR